MTELCSPSCSRRHDRKNHVGEMSGIVIDRVGFPRAPEAVGEFPLVQALDEVGELDRATFIRRDH